MAQEKYTIAFHGRIKDGSDLERVKINLGKLIKRDAKTVDALFSGKRVVLKRDMNRQGANTFKAAFEKTGALCDIEGTEALAAIPRLEMERKKSAPDAHDIPLPSMHTCPNCGHEQVFEKECHKCGIVFEKFVQPPVEPPAPESPTQHPPVSDEMKEGVARAKMLGQMSVAATKKRQNRRRIFKLARIVLLLCVLMVVATYTTWTHAKIASWKKPLDVVIYPINGDKTVGTEAFIGALDADDFIAIETFMADEAASFELPIEQPVTVHLAPAIASLPPAPPTNRFPVSVVWWSLKFRYWAFKHNPHEGPSDIRIYVVFKALEENSARLEESLGLRKGLIGIVNTASGHRYLDDTNIVVTHELMHTLGATDKYNIKTLAPIFPDGYADPDKTPRYPQFRGEIMAVRVPLSEDSFTMPTNLNQLTINKKTCTEIKWCQPEEH